MYIVAHRHCAAQTEQNAQAETAVERLHSKHQN